MQSRTSCFNKTVFRKNLTRFAPVWVLYTICLLLGLFLLYTNGGAIGSFNQKFWFATNYAEMIPVMGVVNLFYALLVAELLFGDLFTPRTCNMLHAMPLRRETWFFTNLASGLLFSLVPTAVMALISIPLLMNTIFENAWKIALLWFAAGNLQYVCFLGIAAFAAMCVGSRFTMAAGYGLLNAGAYIVYWLIDTVYTPMLYGVVTPITLATNLTPVYHMTNFSYLQTDSRSVLRQQFGDNFEGAIAKLALTEHWWRLWLWAGVGIAFALAALWLYRKRNLECAGDAVAFKPLVPVFQVICAVFVMTCGQLFLAVFLGLDEQNYPILAAGLVVGWFIGRMLIERTTRVFRLRNWYGLGALAAALVLTLICTHFDILDIETRLPNPDRVEKVYLETGYVSNMELDSREDILAMIALQELALEERAESSGAYVLGTNGEWVRNVDTYADVIDEEDPDPQYRYVASISLRYELKNGNNIRRRYKVWVDSGAGSIANKYLNEWDAVNEQTTTVDGLKVKRLEVVLDTLEEIHVDYLAREKIPEAIQTRAVAEELIAAVKADCAEGHMAQHPYFHSGHFRIKNEEYEKGYMETDRIYVHLGGEKYGWSVEIYADSHHCLNWMRQYDLLPDVEIRTENLGNY